MKKKNISSGRVRQKLQTRRVILDAARRIMNTNKKITLDDVAKQAGISRATIYRYFSNIDVLIAEASLDLHHKSPEQLQKELPGMNLQDRILYIQNYYNQLAQDQETLFRRYLSAVLAESTNTSSSLRGARRVKALTQSLQPFESEIPEEIRKRLIHVVSVLTGIDALVVCKDVCRLSNDDASTTLKWGVEMVLRGIFCRDAFTQSV